MEWKLDTASVVIVGAGFSAAATNGRMPLMNGYFDRLRADAYPLLYELVLTVAGEVATANVETVLLALDQFKTSPDVALEGWADKWKRGLPQLKRELSLYTLSRLRESLAVEEGNWAMQLLADAGPKTTVISMNYDNIAERTLSNRDGMTHGRKGNCPHCKMRFLLEKACSCIGRDTDITPSDWQGALLKPHGSIAWKRCLNPECCSYDCLVANERCQPFEACNCPNCGAQCGPVMVMPAMSKSLNEIPEIAVMWKAVHKAICDAENIVLFGFSMPTSDELLMQLVRSSVHCNRRLRRVASIDLRPDGVLGRFKRCIPDGMDVELVALPVVPGTSPGWVKFDEKGVGTIHT